MSLIVSILHLVKGAVVEINLSPLILPFDLVSWEVFILIKTISVADVSSGVKVEDMSLQLVKQKIATKVLEASIDRSSRVAKFIFESNGDGDLWFPLKAGSYNDDFWKRK
ncbi:hypothetical protein [Pseudomonas sp. TWP3-2]|uniref:hypothetical protein n=1 Tax=Pseudomonas sp. TWP3-2 TaxID=2804574 RepID=UPI003CFA8204